MRDTAVERTNETARISEPIAAENRIIDSAVDYSVAEEARPVSTVTNDEVTRNSNETLDRAIEAAVDLGLTRRDVHRLADGTWLPFSTPQEYRDWASRSEEREREQQLEENLAARDEGTLVREDLVRDVSNVGTQETITANEVTLVAREVTAATQVELLITGITSGAQRRVTINIEPGASRLNRQYEGRRPQFTTNTRRPTSDQVRTAATSRGATRSDVETIRTSRNARTGIVSRTGRTNTSTRSNTGRR
jgi:hypothetical protein